MTTQDLTNAQTQEHMAQTENVTYESIHTTNGRTTWSGHVGKIFTLHARKKASARTMGDTTRKRKEYSDLEYKILQLIKNKARIEASIASIVTDRTATEVSSFSRAGDSFGGRSKKE